MKSSIVLLAAIVCAVADPQVLYNGNWPYGYDYRPIINPITPNVREVIPDILPAQSYYTGLKYLDRDIIGQTKYGQIEPGQSHHGVQDVFGNKAGRLSYYDSLGKVVETSYVADGAGYRVESKNLEPLVDKIVPLIRGKRDVLLTTGNTHLISPIIPTIDYKITPHALPTTITQPKLKADGFLDDTPEVKLAKDRHFTEIEAAKLRNLSPFVPLTHSPIIQYPFFDYRFIDPIVRY